MFFVILWMVFFSWHPMPHFSTPPDLYTAFFTIFTSHTCPRTGQDKSDKMTRSACHHKIQSKVLTVHDSVLDNVWPSQRVLITNVSFSLCSYMLCFCCEDAKLNQNRSWLCSLFNRNCLHKVRIDSWDWRLVEQDNWRDLATMAPQYVQSWLWLDMISKA